MLELTLAAQKWATQWKAHASRDGWLPKGVERLNLGAVLPGEQGLQEALDAGPPWLLGETAGLLKQHAYTQEASFLRGSRDFQAHRNGSAEPGT